MIRMGIIRSLLAIAVIISHTKQDFLGFGLIPGYVAVECFFMISGFYMSLVLNGKYASIKYRKTFYINRLLRIFPAYWITLGVVFSISCFSYYNNGNGLYLEPYLEYWDDLEILPLCLLFFSNIFIFGQDIIMFLGIDMTSSSLFWVSDFRNSDPMLYTFLFIPQAWSLSLELLFYFISPFLVKRKTKTLMVIIGASIILRFLIYFGLGWVNDPWTYRFFPCELAFFLAGMLSHRLYVFGISNHWFSKGKSLVVYLAILAVIFIFPFIPFYEKSYAHIINWSFYFLFFLSLPPIFSLSKKWTWDRFIGEFSYPLYISHFFILDVFVSLSNDSQYLTEKVILVAIAFSYLLILANKPIESFRAVNATR